MRRPEREVSDVRQPADELAPWRQSVDAVVVRFLDWLVAWLQQHWLLLVNLAVAVFVALPLLAPILMAVGQADLARTIYYLYSYTCHQLPSRSFYLFGYQMAYCERDNAIYGSALLAGLAFGAWRARLPRLSFRAYLVLILPMAVDGFTQAFGWRESTWELRTVTGILFGVASVWLTYPYIQKAMDEGAGR